MKNRKVKLTEPNLSPKKKKIQTDKTSARLIRKYRRFNLLKTGKKEGTTTTDFTQ